MRKDIARSIIAVGFYRQHKANIKRALRHIEGIDFADEVSVVTLEPGDELKQFQSNSLDTDGKPVAKQGNYYAHDECKAEELGINPKYKDKTSGEIRERFVHIYVVKCHVLALVSKAKAIVDTWSNPDEPFSACGSATQVCALEKSAFSLKL